MEMYANLQIRDLQHWVVRPAPPCILQPRGVVGPCSIWVDRNCGFAVLANSSHKPHELPLRRKGRHNSPLRLALCHVLPCKIRALQRRHINMQGAESVRSTYIGCVYRAVLA
jgi:hypothetical protein